MDDAHDPGQASHVPRTPGIPSFRNRLFAPPAWCVRTVIVSAFDRSDPVDRPSTSATTPVRGRCDARRVSRSPVIRRSRIWTMTSPPCTWLEHRGRVENERIPERQQTDESLRVEREKAD